MNNQKTWIIAGVITLIAAVPRVATLDAFLSPDEPQWEKNSLGFLEGLRGGDMNLLYQQPHPGITTTWLAVPTIERESWGVKRLPLALFLSLAIGALTFLMIRLWGNFAGGLAGLLLAIDPHLIAHSRVLAMDALLSVFIILAVVTYLLWQKTSQQGYLFVSGAAGALAVLSKLSGATVVLFILVLLVIDIVRRGGGTRALAVWAAGGIITAIIVLPTLVSNFPYVWAGTKLFFATEHYSQQVHALGPWWYPQALAIWTTPVQWIGVVVLPWLFVRRSRWRGDGLVLAVYLLLFFLVVQYSIKKGDRYLLPDFALLNVITALSLVSFKKVGARAVTILLAVAIVWQVMALVQLHPYYLAYRNPFARQLTTERTMGWGEGLDQAAAYLNKKPGAEEMLVIAYYEGPFEYHFKGRVTSAERLARESAQEIGGQYVVLYRAMEGRAAGRWETKVLEEYRQQTPEHVVTINEEEYVWIYKVP